MEEKRGGEDLPASAVVGDDDAEEQAARDGRNLDEVVEERSSLGELVASAASHKAAPSRVHLHAIRSRQLIMTHKEEQQRPEMKAIKVPDSLSWRKSISRAASRLNKFSNDGNFMNQFLDQTSDLASSNAKVLEVDSSHSSCRPAENASEVRVKSNAKVLEVDSFHRSCRPAKNASEVGVKSGDVCINDVLPLDLLTEILVRVDSIELFRCKCVCKSWFSCFEHYSYFIGQFILQRSKKPPPLSEDEVDDELIRVEWNLRGRFLSPIWVVLTPTWYGLSASKFCLDFLPIYDAIVLSTRRLIHRVIGYSNGLVLCSYSNSKFSVEGYCICNPITKQWLKLPLSPPCSCKRNMQVGFTSDQFYHIHDDHSVSVNHRFCVKVVRMDFSCCKDDQNDGVIKVEMFSSDSGCWTTFRLQLPDYVTKLNIRDEDHMVPCDRRIYWLVEDGTKVLVYDTNNNTFLTDCFDLPSSASDYSFRELSRCGNSVWLAQTFSEKLQVYTLVGCKWVLIHKVDDILRDMQWSSSSVKEHAARGLTDALSYFTMDPRNLMAGYMSVSNMLIKCNFDSKTVTPVTEDDYFPPYLLSISLPIWPTPLPLLPNA